MKKNKFSKALRHLKSTELDEKIKSLNESPTNSIGGVYALNQPGQRLGLKNPEKVFYPDADGNWPAGIPGTPGKPNYVRPAGYWDEGPGATVDNPYDTLYTADWSYSVQEENPRNTETLIDPDTGYVLSELPPDSRSFILGPLVDLYFHNHGNDNRTFVGYIQKDTREFVLLGRVNGRWGDDNDGNLISQDGFTYGRIWNGLESGFSASNSNFTFEMLQWFHDKLKAGKYVKRAAFFQSGGTPVLSGTGGEGQPDGTVQGNAVGAGPGNASDGGDANVGSGIGGTPNIGTPQDDPNHGGPGEAILWGLISSLVGKLGPLGLAVNAVGDILKLVDQLPALDYSKDIAMSILTGKPIVHDQSDIPQNQIDALVNNISSNMIGNSIPVTNQEIPYADDNIKTNLSGKVSPNVGPNKVPNTTGPMSFNDPGPAGLLNPLHAAGQAQGQVVIPSDGSKPYFKYTDHAYYNPNSTDPGEVPDPIKSVLANLIQSIGGGLDGYPEQIKGDSIKTFEVPVSELPSNLQTAVQKELDYQNIVKTQKDNQTQSDIKYTDDIEKFFDLGQPETNNTPSNVTYTDDPVKFFSNPQSEPQSPPLSSYQSKQEVVKSKTYQDKLKGTWADPTFRAQEVARVRANYLATNPKYPNAPPAAGGVGDPKWMDQQAEKARARARGEVVNYISKPVANVQDIDRAQLEKNIEDSLKQLEIDNENLKGEKLRRNLALAADIGLDVLTVITLLTPIPGDEVAALSAQATKAGVKTGAKTAAQQTTIDAFRIKLTSPDTLAKAQQAINKAGPGFADDVAIQLTANGKTGIFKAKDILRSKGFKVESVNVNLTESRKRILREIKQPYKLPEQPKQKYKMNFKGKFTSQNTPNVTASKKSDDIVSAKNAAGQTWRTKDKYWSGYESTERMNIIYDHVGHGQLYWDTIVDENRNRKNMRDREIQEHLNLIDHNKAMKEIIEQQTLDAPKDPLFKKVADRLKTEIDYPDKPSKSGYPDTPPPKMVNGFHPEYGKRYKYDKLDPHSAEAMPATGNPEIDANVQKARKAKKLKESKNYKIGKKTLKQFSEETWSPISGSGPTNSTAQTFSYSAQNFETGQANTVTVSGLGGVESTPSTVTINYGFGETEVVSAPTFSQLGLQGYAKPLGMNVRRRTDLKNVNPQLDASQEFAQTVGADYMMNARVQQSIRQEVETDLAKIAAKFNSSLIGNMGQNIKLAVEAILKGQQPPLVVPPDPPFTGMTHEQLVDETNKVNDRYNDLLAPLQKKLDSYAGQLAPEGLVAKINDLVEAQNKETNALYEKNLKDNQEYGDLLAKHTDEWGKFVNAIEDYRKEFNLKDQSTNYWNPDSVLSKAGLSYGEIASNNLSDLIINPSGAITTTTVDLLIKAAEKTLGSKLGVESAINVLNYHKEWMKNPTSEPQDMTSVISRGDYNFLNNMVKNAVSSQSSKGTDDMLSLAITGDLNKHQNKDDDADRPGLRNIFGNLDSTRRESGPSGDGAYIVTDENGDQYVEFRKAYEFDMQPIPYLGDLIPGLPRVFPAVSDFAGVGNPLAKVGAVPYGMSKLGAYASVFGTDTMNIVVRIPLNKRRKKKKEEK